MSEKGRASYNEAQKQEFRRKTIEDPEYSKARRMTEKLSDIEQSEEPQSEEDSEELEDEYDEAGRKFTDERPYFEDNYEEAMKQKYDDYKNRIEDPDNILKGVEEPKSIDDLREIGNKMFLEKNKKSK